MPINTELLTQIRDKILSTPRAYDQSTWGHYESSAPCGTRACIAGWACHLGGVVTLEDLRRPGSRVHATIPDRAQALLGLTSDEAQTLFTPTPDGSRNDDDDDEDDKFPEWPEPFGSQYGAAKSRKTRAEVAAAYLAHIIETGKVTA